MLHVEELSYGNLSGGLFDGICAIHLNLGVSANARDLEVQVLLTSILEFGRTRILRVSGDFKHTSQDDLKLLLSSLRENGFTVSAVTHGEERFSWFDEVVYRVVLLSEAPWLMYQAHEIHFNPMVKEDIKPPTLTDIHKTSTLYIDVERDLKPTEVFSFMQRNPLWRIHSEPRKVYRMALPIKEEL